MFKRTYNNQLALAHDVLLSKPSRKNGRKFPGEKSDSAKKKGKMEKWKREKKEEKQVFAPDGTMHLSVKMTSDIPKKRCGLGKFSCVKESKKSTEEASCG